MTCLDYVAELYHFYTPAIRGAISHLTEIHREAEAVKIFLTSKLTADKNFYNTTSGHAANPPISVSYLNSNR